MSKFNVERDPKDVKIERHSGKKLVLGLDLGTTTGYAYQWVEPGTTAKEGASGLVLGQWDLSAGPYDSGAIRFLRLRHFLAQVSPDLVGFEDVKYTPVGKPSMSTIAAILSRAATSCEWFGALKATLATWCEEHGVPCVGLPIGSIKRRATGKGNASKEEVIEACNSEFSFQFCINDYHLTGIDNVADAIYVCKLVTEQHYRGI